MPRSVCYHLSSAQTGTLPGAATIQVIRPARIYGVHFSQSALGGGGNGRHSITLELNNSAQANGDTNNPPRETVLASHQSTFIGGAVTSGVASGQGPYIPLSVPIKSGDILSLNIVQTGTAPASCNTIVDVFCTES